MENEIFDFSLARECAESFSGATGLGCVVSDKQGSILAQYGYNCAGCRICHAARRSDIQCINVQNFGMIESERFGGKYIYCCPMGLTCFVSPILGEFTSCARITAGPFLMVDREDYIACELSELPPEVQDDVIAELANIPAADTSRANQMSNLLFLAVSFMNKVAASNQLLATQSSEALQGRVSDYILHIKQESLPPPYPLAAEKNFLESIRKMDKAETQRLLDELLGHVLFASGHQKDRVLSRMCELLTLAGRAAIDAGVDVESALQICHEGRLALEHAKRIDEMSLLLQDAVNTLIGNVFRYSDIQHAQTLHFCIQYIDSHYFEKISLEQLAEMVYLSPTYLSRIFKKEIGINFNDYLIGVRIEKSKQLLHRKNLRMIDIANSVGFEDQSYFTKTFRKVTGVTPLKYRQKILLKEGLIAR